jgi:hypothetical protein
MIGAKKVQVSEKCQKKISMVLGPRAVDSDVSAGDRECSDGTRKDISLSQEAIPTIRADSVWRSCCDRALMDNGRDGWILAWIMKSAVYRPLNARIGGIQMTERG